MKKYTLWITVFVLFCLLMSPSRVQATSSLTCGETPICAVIMLDRTGSVSNTSPTFNRDNETDAVVGTKIDNAPAGFGSEDLGFLGVLAGHNSGHLVSVGRFGDQTNGSPEAEILGTLQLQDVHANLATMRTNVMNMMTSSSSVGTNLADVVSVGAAELNSSRCPNGYPKYLIIVSDGDPSEPTGPDAAAQAAANTAKTAGIRLITMAFDASGATSADDTNRALLASMAGSNPSSATSFDDFCTSSSCTAANIASEQADGDDFFIATLGADVQNSINYILQSVSCDDGLPCTTDSCDGSNQCHHDLRSGCIACQTDTVCDDHNTCNGTETCGTDHTCQPGTNLSCPSDGNVCNGAESCDPNSGCVHGTSLLCGDGNVCTDDSCDPQSGCTHSNNTASCNDGNACTQTDVCSGGQCSGSNPVTCEASDQCHGVGTCDTQTGLCSNPQKDNGSSCTDDSVCTTQDSCQDGECVPGTPISCDDGNPCTDDSACSSQTGCSHTPKENGTSCSDGLFCNGGETCQAGACMAGTTPACDDENRCTRDSCDLNATDQCKHENIQVGDEDNEKASCGVGVCAHTIDLCVDGEIQVCDPFEGKHAESCNGLDDDCDETVDNGGNSLCDDHNVCNGTETCDGADGCSAGTPLNCDDGNPCTSDSCDPSGGCQHTNNTDSCDDGLFCNGGDTCGGGTCHHAGDPCAAGSDCANTCNEDADSCNDPLGTSCGSSADTQCTHPDTCDGEGHCVANNESSGTNCGDAESACVNQDTCDSAGHCSDNGFKSAETACGDSSDTECSNPDHCSGTSSACVSADEPAGTNCGDAGSDCVNQDQCNGEGSCTDNGFKSPGTSCGSPADTDCDNPDTCNADGNCVPNLASSETHCTDDDNACTDDFCNGDGGCTHTANSDSCDDGNVCTVGDTCSDSGCQAGEEPLNCDDHNPCTDDSCDPEAKGGCVHTPNTASCNDGNACTTNDTCSNGECVGGAPLTCDDENPCTDDSCNSTVDLYPLPRFINDELPPDPCVHAPDETNSCSDGDACNGLEACVLLTDGESVTGAECLSGEPPVCDDKNACTSDSCNAETGCQNKDLPDTDGDGVCNLVDDCDTGPQTDTDGDLVPDACDPCPVDAPDDVDGDGICTSVDNCPDIANPDQADSDANGAGDACDDSGVLASCIALPGNEPPLVTFSETKEIRKGVFEIPFSVEDPDGDHVDMSIAADEGSVEIAGGSIFYTLPKPLNIDSDGLAEVTLKVSDSGSCETKTFKTSVKIGVAGDQLGGCALMPERP